MIQIRDVISRCFRTLEYVKEVRDRYDLYYRRNGKEEDKVMASRYARLAIGLEQSIKLLSSTVHEIEMESIS